MNLYRLFPMLILFAVAIPIHGQVQSHPRVDSLLQGASNALDRYQELAPAIRCERASQKTLRDSCRIVLEMLGRDVQDAREKIARYRQLSAPQLVDLFDIYQGFQHIMEGIDSLGYAAELYGQHNRVLFAEAYNNFVKLIAWFGGEVRDFMKDAEKRSECGHT